jgi:hypothetical protein
MNAVLHQVYQLADTVRQGRQLIHGKRETIEGNDEN